MATPQMQKLWATLSKLEEKLEKTIKPCPFCQSTNIQMNYCFITGFEARCDCKNCFTRGPRMWFGSEAKKMSNPKLAKALIEGAIAKWNIPVGAPVYKVGEKNPPMSNAMDIIPILVFDPIYYKAWVMGHFYGGVLMEWRIAGSNQSARPSHWSPLPPAPPLPKPTKGK